MNIYYYTFHIFYQISKELKKENPTWFANLALTLFIVLNIIEINFLFTKIKYGAFVEMGKLFVIVVSISVYFINYLIIIKPQKYLSFKKYYEELKGTKKTQLNIVEAVYIIATIILLFLK